MASSFRDAETGRAEVAPKARVLASGGPRFSAPRSGLSQRDKRGSRERVKSSPDASWTSYSRVYKHRFAAHGKDDSICWP